MNRPTDALFIDVEAIEAGTDFVSAIEAEIERADVLLAVIGRRWLDIADDQGRRRLDDPSDFVRLELESAMRQGVRIVPILVDDATMPSGADLPTSIRDLSRQNALSVSNLRWRSDLQDVVRLLDSIDGAGRSSAGANEERKVVTVLSCDVMDRTGEEGPLDPEDRYDLLSRYHSIVRARIEGHGGVVESIVGDAVIGIFGIPVAHEDDPERAVRAALWIVSDLEPLDLPEPARIGVATGRAFVRFGFEPGDGKALAACDCLPTASRLQLLADDLGILVDGRTHTATAPTIEYAAEEPGEEDRGGWTPLRPRSRVGSTGPEATPFIGREVELAALVRLFDQSVARPSTEFVTIVAEPGLGKSRLVRELKRHVEQLPELVSWREGRCLPYGEGVSLWALAEIVKGHAGILDTDDQETLFAKLDAVLTEPDPQTRAWMKDRLSPLVGLSVSTSPPEQEEAFSAWRRFIEQIAASGPTVLVVEDLHWADAGFIAFLESLADRTAGLPLLVVTTARPEVEDSHPTWLGHSRRFTVLSIEPLADADLSDLVEACVPDADPTFVSLVVDRVGGSPLFAEQLAAMLRDRGPKFGGDALGRELIPDDLHALIAARIDLLPPSLKAALLDAAVVGRTFWTGALRALRHADNLSQALAELLRRELIRPVKPSTMEGDEEFVFWHALVRDVAYDELTKRQRALKHEAAANWIEGQAGTALGEHADLIVHHLDIALDLSAAAPSLNAQDLKARLGNALLTAGSAAMRTHIPSAALLLTRALGLLGPEDPRRVFALRLLAQARQSAGDLVGARSVLEDIVVHNDANVGDPLAAGDVVDLATVMWRQGEGSQADELLAQARSRVGDAPSPALALLLAEEAHLLLWDRDFAAVLAASEASIGMSQELGIDPLPKALATRGLARIMLGDPEGAADARGSVAGFVGAGQPFRACITLHNVAEAMSTASGPAAALASEEESLAFAERYGIDALIWSGRAQRLERLAEMGRFDEVVAGAGPIIEWARLHDDLVVRFVAWQSLARVDIEGGGHRVEHAELARITTQLGDEPYLIFAGLLAHARHDPAARSWVTKGVGVAEQKWVFLAARACAEVGLGEEVEALLNRSVPHYPLEKASRFGAAGVFDEMRGEFGAAASQFEEASGLFEAAGSTIEQAHALQSLGRCLLASGANDEGLIRLREARALWEPMPAPRRVEEVDDMLDALGSRDPH